ncbi:hypothetical protein N7451_012545 [Penicillium sp. IBT 35674x]|nr:hypothetical protein N7451_012545 [Penicillium sp. IBT 35674x]
MAFRATSTSYLLQTSTYEYIPLNANAGYAALAAWRLVSWSLRQKERIGWHSEENGTGSC